MNRKLVLLFLIASTAIYRSRSALAPGAACKNDSDCEEFYICTGSPTTTCTHKSLFPNASSKELGGVFIAFIANTMCNAGGVGAGGLLVPYLTLLNNFTPNTGVVLTYAIVFGGGIGTVLNVITKKNPATGGPMISFNILMLCIPCLLAGVPIGVLLNKILAPVVVNALLFCLLIFSFTKIFLRFRENFKKEKLERQKEKEKGEESAMELKVLEKEAPLNINGKLASKKENMGQIAEKSEGISSPVVLSPKESQNSGYATVRIEEPTKENKNSEKEKQLAPSPQIEADLTYRVDLEATQKYGSIRISVKKQEGDNQELGGGLYEIGINNALGLMMVVSGPQKLMDVARESEKRDIIERRRSIDVQKASHVPDSGVPNINSNNEAVDQKKQADIKELKEAFLKREKSMIPPRKAFIPFLSLLIVIIVNLIIGNSKFKSITHHITYCSSTYWGLFVLSIFLQVCVYLLSVTLLFRWQKQKDELDIEFRPEDLRLTSRRAAIIFFVSFFAGILGGVLAIGGALVIAPFMLGYGVPPQPLASTTAVFMIFTQLSTLIISILSSSYSGSDLAFYLCVAAVFSFGASRFVFWFVKKTNRQSIILGVLLTIIAISFIINITAMGIDIASNKTFMTSFVAYC